MSTALPKFIKPAAASGETLIDKEELIAALKKLLEDHPQEIIPYEAVLQVLGKFVARKLPEELSQNEKIRHLDDILAKVKSEGLLNSKNHK